MASAFARDLAGYQQMMQARGGDQVEIDRQVELRRRAMAAATPEAAVAAIADL